MQEDYIDEEKKIPLQSKSRLLAAKCLVSLQTYKLKTNLVSVNMPQPEYYQYYQYFSSNIANRYKFIRDKLQQTLRDLEVNLLLAESANLRVLNNIFRNYRRRVGLLSNEPLSSLKFNKFDKNEKILNESIIFNQIDKIDKIQQFFKQIQDMNAASDSQISTKFVYSDKIKQNYKNIIDTIFSTECYSQRYYDNFQRNVLNTTSLLHSHFDKLTGYLTVWQNLASTKAYQISSAKQEQVDRLLNESDRNKSKMEEEETQEQLQDLISKCHEHSALKDEYKKRLADVRHYNNQRKKKQDMIGIMRSKRKNKHGILNSRNRQITLIDWYKGYDGEKIQHNFQDQFKNYTASNEQNEYRLTHYEIQQPKKKADEMKVYMEKYHIGLPMRLECWYDKFGINKNFDLIDTPANMLQNRIEFESNRQMQLQNADDRKKRQFVEKQLHVTKENERREALHVGYRIIHDKEELQKLSQRAYNMEFLPPVQPVKSLEFSDSQDDDEYMVGEKENEHQQDTNKIKNKISKQSKPLQSKVNEIPAFLTISKSEAFPIPKTHKIQKQQQASKGVIGKVIDCYFKQIAKKIYRKDQIPENALNEGQNDKHKLMSFFYFQKIQSINWNKIAQCITQLRIFIVTQSAVIYLQKFISCSKVDIKCSSFSMNEEIDNVSLREHVRECFDKNALVTFKECSCQQQISAQEIKYFIIGLLKILVEENEIGENYQLDKYLEDGKDIIQDFTEYFYQDVTSSNRQELSKMEANHSKADLSLSLKLQKSEEKQTIDENRGTLKRINSRSDIKLEYVENENEEPNEQDSNFESTEIGL